MLSCAIQSSSWNAQVLETYLDLHLDFWILIFLLGCGTRLVQNLHDYVKKNCAGSCF